MFQPPGHSVSSGRRDSRLVDFCHQYVGPGSSEGRTFEVQSTIGKSSSGRHGLQRCLARLVTLVSSLILIHQAGGASGVTSDEIARNLTRAFMQSHEIYTTMPQTCTLESLNGLPAWYGGDILKNAGSLEKQRHFNPRLRCEIRAVKNAHGYLESHQSNCKQNRYLLVLMPLDSGLGSNMNEVRISLRKVVSVSLF